LRGMSEKNLEIAPRFLRRVLARFALA